MPYLGISAMMSSLTLLVTTLQARVKNPGARQDCRTGSVRQTEAYSALPELVVHT